MRSWSLVVFLLACTPTSDSWTTLESQGGVELPRPDAPMPPPSVSLSGTAPVAGETVTYRLTGLAQGDQAFFFLSTRNVQQGAGPCPAQLGGVCGDLRSPKSLGNDTANANGVAKVNVGLPASLQADQLLNVQALVQRPGGAVLVTGIWSDHVEVDEDQDGVTHVTDCDDADPTRYPGAVELCDLRDNDCDALADEGCPAIDDDGDGFDQAQDCDDTDASVFPGAAELCDQRDNDCDALVDEGCPGAGTDDDGDGFTAQGGDCDDTDPSVNPAMFELCDQRDNDCDGLVDEGCPGAGTDDDGDGFTAQGGDCDDTDPSVNPAAVEVVGDGIDQDCDGTENCYADNDDDGAPIPSVRLGGSNGDLDCDDPFEGTEADFVIVGEDCNDANNTISPLATEVCDGVDNNCRGGVDEGCP